LVKAATDNLFYLALVQVYTGSKLGQWLALMAKSMGAL